MPRALVRLVDFLGDQLVVNRTAGSEWQLGAFRMLAESRSAGGKEGGDFYAYRLRGPNRLAVVIGDACGRGREGAKVLPGVLSRLQQIAATTVRPGHLLGELNRCLVRELRSDRFVTGAALEIDAAAGTLMVANAGHVPAVLRRSGKVTVIGRASGPPLGILNDSVYPDESYALQRGDVMVLMTDGIVEAVETDLAEMPTLKGLVAQAGDDGGAVHRCLTKELRAERPGREADDMTLVSLEILEEASSSDPASLHRTI
jgi:serine phosphatase RsbU (regulator of sigma subunit)